jgi:YggT family protein
MFIFGNILHGIADVLDVVLNIYMWLIIIRALISWVNPDPHNPIVQILHRLTEPALRPCETGSESEQIFTAHRDPYHHILG